MAAPSYSTADYAAALMALLPRGRAWPRDADATLPKLMTGLAESTADSNVSANDLLVQAFPATADEMLPEWEAALGLPGIYGVTPDTLEGRQAAVVAALTDTGGQSKDYFIALALSLGFVITIDEFTVATVNSFVETAIAGPEWAHVWQVNADAAIAITYTPDVDIVQATPNFGNPLLESVLAKFKPAHTACITSYT